MAIALLALSAAQHSPAGTPKAEAADADLAVESVPVDTADEKAGVYAWPKTDAAHRSLVFKSPQPVVDIAITRDARFIILLVRVGAENQDLIVLRQKEGLQYEEHGSRLARTALHAAFHSANGGDPPMSQLPQYGTVEYMRLSPDGKSLHVGITATFKSGGFGDGSLYPVFGTTIFFPESKRFMPAPRSRPAP